MSQSMFFKTLKVKLSRSLSGLWTQLCILLSSEKGGSFRTRI